MNIHEYQSKNILRDYGVNVPNGNVAYSIDEAVEYAKRINSDVKVVKAQIHAGGRGKAGGVKIAKDLTEVREYAKEIVGKVLGILKTTSTTPIQWEAVCLPVGSMWTWSVLPAMKIQPVQHCNWV